MCPSITYLRRTKHLNELGHQPCGRLADTSKIVISNRNIDDLEDSREIAPVALDLDFAEEPGDPVRSDNGFRDAITIASATVRHDQPIQTERQTLREAAKRAEAEFKTISDRIKEETGYAIGYKPPWAYPPKQKAAYNLWKRVIPLFIDRPEMLDLGPTALARLLAANEHNYQITRDMMYDQLNQLAVKDLARLLISRKTPLVLKGPVTIRSVQLLLKAQRDAGCQPAAEEYRLLLRIEGDAACFNGIPYKIQGGSSDQPRIRHAGVWIRVDTLKSLCSG